MTQRPPYRRALQKAVPMTLTKDHWSRSGSGCVEFSCDGFPAGNQWATNIKNTLERWFLLQPGWEFNARGLVGENMQRWIVGFT